MFASYIEMRMKSGSVYQAKDLTSVLEPEIRALGLKQFLLIDKETMKSWLLPSTRLLRSKKRRRRVQRTFWVNMQICL